VFAYSNRAGDERSLVVYHNKFATARGWIKSSVAYSVKAGGDGDRTLVQRTLGEGLGLRDDGRHFYVFRDHITGLEYIRNGRDMTENGLYVELDAYKCQVFLDWREVQDNEWHQYAHLADYLGGRGVPSIEEALREVFLQPVHYPFKELVNAGTFRRLMDSRVTELDEPLDGDLLIEIQEKTLHLLREMKEFTGGDEDVTGIAQEIQYKLEASLQLPALDRRFPLTRSRKYKAAVETVGDHLDDDAAAWGTLLAWVFTHALGKVVSDEDFAAQGRSWMDEWLLGKLVAGALQDLGLDEGAAWWAVSTVKILINHQGWHETDAPASERVSQILISWLKDSEVQQLLRVNRYGGVLWFNHETFEALRTWMLTMAAVEISADPERAPESVARDIVACYDVVKKLRQAEEASEYQVVKLIEAAKS